MTVYTTRVEPLTRQTLTSSSPLHLPIHFNLTQPYALISKVLPVTHHPSCHRLLPYPHLHAVGDLLRTILTRTSPLYSQRSTASANISRRVSPRSLRRPRARNMSRRCQTPVRLAVNPGCRQPLTSSEPTTRQQSPLAEPMPPTHLVPQSTGQSTNTIDAAYEGVLSTLESLESLAQGGRSAGSAQHAEPTQIGSAQHAEPTQISSSSPSLTHTSASSQLHFRNASQASSFLGEVARLERVVEETEPSSHSESRSSSVDPRRRGMEASIQSWARGHLPPLPIPQGSPTKASDLIRLFETRSAVRNPPAAGLPPVPRIHHSPSPETARPYFQPITSTPTFRPAPSSFPSPPKATSPLSSVKTMIASWRGRSGSEAQRAVDSPGKDGETPRLFGRDRGWNVSIRRRRRHEQSERMLAEQAEEHPTHLPIVDTASSGQYDGSYRTDLPDLPPSSVASSYRTFEPPQAPKQMEGDVCSFLPANTQS